MSNRTENPESAEAFCANSTTSAEKQSDLHKESSETKKLYIVRHGQTLFNVKQKIQGWCDSTLTPKGHEQAARVREYLDSHNIHPDYFACSDLGRTEATLKDITDHPYDRIAGLREFHFGDLEGESLDLCCKKGDDLETYYKQFGGESKSEVEKRMSDTVHSIMERPDVHTALLVSHGACSYRFAHTVDPVRAKKLRKFANCVIYEYEYKDGKFILNDIIDEHVRDLS